MTFGEKGKEGARGHDLKDVEAILDVFQRHGHTEVSRRTIIEKHNYNSDRFAFNRLTPLYRTQAGRPRSILVRYVTPWPPYLLQTLTLTHSRQTMIHGMSYHLTDRSTGKPVASSWKQSSTRLAVSNTRAKAYARISRSS